MRCLTRAASSAARSEGESRMMGDVGRAKLEGDIPGDIGLRRAKPGESTEDVGESEGEER